MALVAKKRMSQTWRDALAEQAGARAPDVLADFDEALAGGTPEHEAAYAALAAHGLLAVVDLPGDPSRSLAEAEEAQIAPDDGRPAG
jgi:hypothetical protein